MGSRPRIRRQTTPVVEDAVLALGGCDHVDAVAVDVPPGTTAVDFVNGMLGSPPGWIRGLLAVRDHLVAPFGLKGSGPAGASVAPGARIGPLQVFTVTDNQVMAGNDDTHLSYRTTFVVRDGERGPEAVCTTVVRFHRRAGTVYFRVIEPFHDVIIGTLARRSAGSATASP